MNFACDRRRRARFLAAALVALLPAACVKPEAPAPNPFAGGWVNADRQQIAFRDNTVVVNPPDAPPTPVSAESCEGAFRFTYGRQNREALLRLTPRQPDLRNRLAGLLVGTEYPVAELDCGGGATTYVLLSDRDLLAIHRDRDIAGIERLSRL